MVCVPRHTEYNSPDTGLAVDDQIISISPTTVLSQEKGKRECNATATVNSPVSPDRKKGRPTRAERKALRERKWRYVARQAAKKGPNSSAETLDDLVVLPKDT